MNLNDPFGRVEKSKAHRYESLCKALQEAGVTTRAQAEAVQRGIVRRAMIGVVLLLLSVALVSLLYPAATGAAIAVAIAIFLWILVTSLNGYRFVERYRQEELSR